MPNWTINTIRTKKKGILSAFINEEGDFNYLIPMPWELDMDSGTVTDHAIAYYITKRLTIPYDKTNLHELISNGFSENWSKQVTEGLTKRIKEDPDYYTPQMLDNLYEMGKQYLSNLTKYGHYNWYDWCCDKGNTKWNACRTDFDASRPTKVRFETAWDAPIPIFQKLCELFPKEQIKFRCEYYEVGVLEEYINDHGCLLLTKKKDVEFDEDYF